MELKSLVQFTLRQIFFSSRSFGTISLRANFLVKILKPAKTLFSHLKNHDRPRTASETLTFVQFDESQFQSNFMKFSCRNSLTQIKFSFRSNFPPGFLLFHRWFSKDVKTPSTFCVFRASAMFLNDNLSFVFNCAITLSSYENVNNSKQALRMRKISSSILLVISLTSLCEHFKEHEIS